MSHGIKSFTAFSSVSILGIVSSLLVRVQVYEHNFYQQIEKHHLLVNLSSSSCNIINPEEGSNFQYGSGGIVYSGQILRMIRSHNLCQLTISGDESSTPLNSISYPIGTRSILWELFRG